jgi:glycosyltransferase involved in cell wall biosynthesis
MHTVIERNSRLYSNPLVNFLARTAVLMVSRLIVGASDRVMVHNHLMKEVLLTGYALREEDRKIVVIPHGVREASESPGVSEDGGEPLILLLGFVREGKGIEYVVRAFERFRESSPRAKLLIVGDFHPHDRAGYIEDLKRLLSSNVKRNVAFTGFLDEESLDRLVRMSDILVLSSMERCFVETSGVLARVADYGKPVICSRVPKFEGELRDGEECIMTDPSNPEEIANALSSVTQNPQLAKRLGEKLREKFQNRSWSSVGKQHLELYRSFYRDHR